MTRNEDSKVFEAHKATSQNAASNSQLQHAGDEQSLQVEAADKEKLLLSISEAQKLLSIRATLLKKLIRSGEIRSLKIGTGRGRRLIARTALEEFIANNETGGWQ